MAKDDFQTVLKGKKLPILTLDNKWYRLFEKNMTPEMKRLEGRINDLLKEQGNEVACIVNLNPHLQPINFTIIGLGSQNTCMVPMTNIFQSALLSGASYIMLLHNHPSGNEVILE